MLKAERAQIHNELGRLYASQQQAAEARAAHLAALALLQGEGAAPTAPDSVRFELARTYYFLGTQARPLPAASQRRGVGPAEVSDEQRDSLAKAVALLKAMPASPATNPECLHLLALCYLEGAPAKDGRGSETRGGAERALELLEGLAQVHPGVPDYTYDLTEALARIRIPQPPISPETQRSIEDRLGRALALLEKLVAQYPDVPDFPAAKARIHDKLGSFHRQLGRWAEAEEQFLKAIALQSPLVKQLPDSPYYGLWRASFGIAHADALIRRNRPDQARTELEETIAALERQVAQRPDTSRPNDLLALGYSRLAQALRQLGELERANEAERKAEQERGAIGHAPDLRGSR